MKFKIAIGGCIVFSLLASMVYQNNHRLKQTEWLIGTWENKTSRGNIYETWVKISDLELSGKSYIINGNDTIVFENISLIEKNNTLIYIPTVRDQNANQGVRFASVSVTDKKMKFENKAHDFPQYISYSRISNDSLVAEISGISKGLMKKQLFPMRRIK